ncbi:hypothetical protein D3C75_754800 [compost metagenome]
MLELAILKQLAKLLQRSGEALLAHRDVADRAAPGLLRLNLQLDHFSGPVQHIRMIDLIPIMVLARDPEERNDRASEFLRRLSCSGDRGYDFINDEQRSSEQSALLSAGDHQRLRLFQQFQRAPNRFMMIEFGVIAAQNFRQTAAVHTAVTLAVQPGGTLLSGTFMLIASAE